MKNYIGTKIIKAESKTSKEYAQFKGNEWDGKDLEGYLVCYPDGYISWSPKEVFEQCYRLISKQEMEHIEVPMRIN